MYIGSRIVLAMGLLLVWRPLLGQTPPVPVADTIKTDLLLLPPREPNRSIYLAGSALAYRGSLSNGYRVFDAGVHLGLCWRQTQRLAGNLDLLIGKVQSGPYLGGPLDAAAVRNRQPNTYFSTRLLCISYQQQLNLLNTYRLRWYLTGGLGLLRYTPEDDQGRSLADLQITRLGDESYSPVTIMLPVGMGFVYKLPNRMTLSFQAGWLNPRTHYLDNIGKLSSAFGRADQTDNVVCYRLAISYPFEKATRKN